MSSPALPTSKERSPEQYSQQQPSLPSHSSSEDDLVVASNPDISVSSRAAIPPISITRSIVNPTPRTPNRVRFALDDDSAGDATIELGDDIDDINDEWPDEQDYAHDEDYGEGETRAPLLTRITAPSVTMANDIDELLGHGRPKSNLGMAFMNMSNSIIGAGIIGM
jgi:sodium-coupled neutral amino acid transporter 11